MRKERVQKLHETLRISNAKAAAYAGIAPSGIGFLRNGKRSPARSGSTTKKYVDGIIRLVSDTGQEAVLSSLIGFTGRGKKALQNALTDWLFEGEEEQRRREATAALEYGNRLDAVMTLLGISNRQLCERARADDAAISRLRRGLSSPFSSPALTRNITHVLLEIAKEKDRLSDLKQLCQLPQLANDTEDYTEILLYRWFFGQTTEHHANVGRILKHISASSPANGKLSHTGIHSHTSGGAQATVLSIAGNAVSDTEDFYMGIRGLRRAVLRFLGGVILQRKKELFLFSNQPMGWLTENKTFFKKWSALMSLCIAGGIQITIIHSIRRDPEELTEGIAGWMPLYLSGKITPYCQSSFLPESGSHTLFLCPGFACINAFLPASQNTTGIYRFDTDKRLLSAHKKHFDAMLENASRLLDVSPGAHEALSLAGLTTVPDMPDVGICVLNDAAYVLKKSAPVTTFRFPHPLMREAFAAYIRFLTG